MVDHLPMDLGEVQKFLGVDYPNYVIRKMLIPFEVKYSRGFYRRMRSPKAMLNRAEGIAPKLDKWYHKGGVGFGSDLPTGRFEEWDLPKWHPRYWDVEFRKICMILNLPKWELYFRKVGRPPYPDIHADVVPPRLRDAMRRRKVTEFEKKQLDRFTYNQVFGWPEMPRWYWRDVDKLFGAGLNVRSDRGIKRKDEPPYRFRESNLPWYIKNRPMPMGMKAVMVKTVSGYKIEWEESV